MINTVENAVSSLSVSPTTVDQTIPSTQISPESKSTDQVVSCRVPSIFKEDIIKDLSINDPSQSVLPPLPISFMKRSTRRTETSLSEDGKECSSESLKKLQNQIESSLCIEKKTCPTYFNELINLIQSECNYYSMLKMVSEIYEPCFKNQYIKLKKIMSEQELSTCEYLISQLSVLSRNHFKFLESLKHLIQFQADSSDSLKDDLVSVLKQYTVYLANLPSTFDIFCKSKKVKEFNKLLEECKAKSRSSIDLGEILIFSSSRIQDYERSFSILLVYTNPMSIGYTLFADCLSHIKEASNYISCLKVMMRNQRSTFSFQDQTIEPAVKPLEGLTAKSEISKNMKESPCDVLYEDTMEMRLISADSNHPRISKVKVRAFENIILVAQIDPSGESEAFDLMLPYLEFKIERSEEERSGFRMVSDSRVYVFITDNKAMTDKWVEKVEECTLKLRSTVAKTTYTESQKQTNLNISIIAGRNLIQNCFIPLNLFVRITLDDVIKETKCIENCCFHPVWNERFIYTLKDRYQKTLLVEVKCKQEKEEQTMACAEIALSSLYENVEKNWWVRFMSMNPNIKSPELLVKIVLTSS
ncbi:uncharacterized protein LOC126326541 [Schistocerca gregaria]|uniref:uncharacterized protein LOC126326541 n=1 Tax=Schistocerca gregaria TaxID=7010 RepID=UPI00211E6A31|nr:uncharacterized protein LOC126326541 [Schistocerca gregaria]